MIDPENPAHFPISNSGQDKTFPNTSGKLLPHSGVDSGGDDILMRMFDETEIPTRIVSQVSTNSQRDFLIHNPPNGPGSKTPPLEEVTTVQLIEKAETIFKEITTNLNRKALAHEDIVGGSGTKYSPQFIATEILKLFSGESAKITSGDKIKDNVVELYRIYKALSKIGSREANPEKRNNAWNVIVYKKVKLELYRISKLS